MLQLSKSKNKFVYLEQILDSSIKNQAEIELD